MDLSQLRAYLDSLAKSLQGEQRDLLTARLNSLASVFPFNEYEYILMFLLDNGVVTFDQYEKLRADYVTANRYLHLYGLAPRIFGEIWAQKHIRDLDEAFLKPNRKLDSTYENGQYDLWISRVRVEVKAARAINTKKSGDLVSKALRYGSSEPFWMNYQQIKFGICDVFVFMSVWVDRIIYWVLSEDEVKSYPGLA